MSTLIAPSLKNRTAINRGSLNYLSAFKGDKNVWNKFMAFKYGQLYNAHVIFDSRELTSDPSWSVPGRNTGFTDLFNYIFTLNHPHGESLLKELGNTYWNTPSVGDNQLHFNARGHGQRSGVNGQFSLLKQQGYWWTSEYNSFPAIYIVGYEYNAEFSLVNYTSNWNFGYGIRLVRNSTSLLNGQSGTYVGNDGKIYRTICINNQEWLAFNLAETKYRNGDPIPLLFYNTDWVESTTGGRCFYDYDPLNQ